MKLVVIDFETYYDNDYSLSKMATEAYIRDPRFEILGCGVLYHGTTGRRFLTHLEDIKQELNCLFVYGYVFAAHHAQFDGLILNHHLGIRPQKWIDTLSMARYVHGAKPFKKSLEALAEHYGLPAKTVPYDQFKGKHWADLIPSARTNLDAGCLHDCELTWYIYQRMKGQIPQEEMDAISLTVKMFTEPHLVGDVELLKKIRDDEFLRKNQALCELDVTEKALCSPTKFKAILEGEGIEVELKEGKNGPIPAFAKSDPFMQELLNNPDERIAALAQARLEVRSTITETRAGRLYEHAKRGPICNYLVPYAAHTLRWGGGDKINLQNLPRKGGIRKALQAPPGYLLATPDQRQGECRILNWLAGQEDVLDRFRRGDDPYLPVASEIFGREVTAEDVEERQVGKVAELSAGFGAGGAKLAKAAKVHFGMGVTMQTAYRATHPKVMELHKEASTILEWLIHGIRDKWHIFTIARGCIWHPNGTRLDYTGLEKTDDGMVLRYGYSTRKIYGALLVENVVQWLSRILSRDAMLRFVAAGYEPVVGMSHDDVWLLVPECSYEDLCLHKARIIEIMREVPDWAPGLPLDAECKVGASYG